MKIALITRHLDLPVGFGSYARHLLDALAKVDRTNQYTVYVPGPIRHRLPKRFTVRASTVPQRRSRLAAWDHWEAPRKAKADGADLIHYLHTACPIPLTRRPVVTGLLDAINWVLPEYRLPRAYDLLARRDARMASHLITLSKASRADIHKRLGVPLSRITATPLASALGNDGPRAAAVSRTLARPFWLFVGGLEKRKNLRLVVEALTLGGFDGTIAVVGPTDPSPIHEDKAALLASLGPRRRQLRWLSRVSDADLTRLYRRARGVLFPSRYEGFGLPVLEAMEAGTPVIAADTSSIPEIAGKAAVLIDPDDAAGLAAAIRRLEADPAARRKLAVKGRRQAAKFSWEQTARDTLAVYRKITRRR